MAHGAGSGAGGGAGGGTGSHGHHFSPLHQLRSVWQRRGKSGPAHNASDSHISVGSAGGSTGGSGGGAVGAAGAAGATFGAGAEAADLSAGQLAQLFANADCLITLWPRLAWFVLAAGHALATSYGTGAASAAGRDVAPALLSSWHAIASAESVGASKADDASEAGTGAGAGAVTGAGGAGQDDPSWQRVAPPLRPAVADWAARSRQLRDAIRQRLFDAVAGRLDDLFASIGQAHWTPVRARDEPADYVQDCSAYLQVHAARASATAAACAAA